MKTEDPYIRKVVLDMIREYHPGSHVYEQILARTFNKVFFGRYY